MPSLRKLSSPRALMLAVAVVTLCFALELTLKLGGAVTVRWVDDVTEAVAALVACVVGIRSALAASGRMRTSWLLVGAGAGCWAAGQMVWTYLELVPGTDAPFPSPADVGFLLFPLLAVAGVSLRPAAAFAGAGRARVLLDGFLIATSLFLVSWATSLGAVVHSDGAGALANAVSLAYPSFDLVLLTIVVMVVSQARAGNRAGMMLLAAGLICLAIGDSGFAYLSAVGSYQTGSLIDAGWVGGFLLLAAAAASDRLDADGHRSSMLPRTALLLPYLPATIAIAVTLEALQSRRHNPVLLTAAALVGAAFVARQMVVLLDNRRLVERISHQAFHDQLTGLANRALFNDRLTHALDLHRRDMRPLTVLLLDLDDFKSVNDSFGHPAGDELLVRVSERLRGSLRAGDTVARLGGDEFAILIEDGGDPLDIAQGVLDSLDHPVMIGTRSLLVRASIGIVALSAVDLAMTSTDLLQQVDVAMYAAKRAGKAAAVVYSPDLDTDETRQLDLRLALLAAIAGAEIEVAYQPSFTADRDLVGFEALARWSVNGEAVPPAVFIPMAQTLGCLPELDLLVLDTTLAYAADHWPAPLTVSVNFGLTTLSSPNVVQRVAERLARHGIEGQRLTVEILETDHIESSSVALAAVHGLRALGVSIAVDDFGVGYASLARLSALAPDIVKVDRSLIVSQTGAAGQSELLSGITEIAHRMGATVVAEGVETDHQLAAVRQAGCDGVQGYLWGRPQSGELAHDAFGNHLPAAEVVTTT